MIFKGEKMIRICFVCHGNICRSPMAEFIFKDILIKNGCEKDFLVCSRATHTDEIWRGQGNPIFPPAREELIRHKISFDSDKRACLLEKGDYDKFDLFIGMDNENLRSMKRIFGFDSENKIRLLLDYCSGGEVSDPWYTRDFSLCYNDIIKGCRALFDVVKKGDM